MWVWSLGQNALIQLSLAGIVQDIFLNFQCMFIIKGPKYTVIEIALFPGQFFPQLFLCVLYFIYPQLNCFIFIIFITF